MIPVDLFIAKILAVLYEKVWMYPLIVHCVFYNVEHVEHCVFYNVAHCVLYNVAHCVFYNVKHLSILIKHFTYSSGVWRLYQCEWSNIFMYTHKLFIGDSTKLPKAYLHYSGLWGIPISHNDSCNCWPKSKNTILLECTFEIIIGAIWNTYVTN